MILIHNYQPYMKLVLLKHIGLEGSTDGGHVLVHLGHLLDQLKYLLL